MVAFVIANKAYVGIGTNGTNFSDFHEFNPYASLDEKFDITEEKVRLQTHLDYFKKVLENDFPNGKKLGFVAQEIGREINTIGSKANHSELQKIVVQMKDELEKIKEQLLNVL